MGKDDLCTCENCGAVHSIAGYDSNICSRLNLAVKFRIAGEFANAEASYGKILSDFGDDPEAYFRRFLCRYGVIYQEDENSHKLIPTCRLPMSENVFSDPDYQSAYKLADNDAKNSYKNDAVEIADILGSNDNNRDEEKNKQCAKHDDYSDVSAFLSDKQSSKKMYWCREHHHIIDGHDGKYWSILALHKEPIRLNMPFYLVFMLCLCYTYHVSSKPALFPIHEYSCRIADRDTSAFSDVRRMFKN